MITEAMKSHEVSSIIQCKAQRIWGANDVGSSSSPKAWESGIFMSKGGNIWMPYLKENSTHSSSSSCSFKSDTECVEQSFVLLGGDSLLSLPIQALISSGNPLTDIPAIWLPVNLIHKIQLTHALILWKYNEIVMPASRYWQHQDAYRSKLRLLNFSSFISLWANLVSKWGG